MGVAVKMPLSLQDRAAHRLAVLLRDSTDRKGEMAEAVSRLADAGLWEGILPPNPTPDQFATAIILNNPLMRENLMNQRLEWSPQGQETVGDLISCLMPASGGLD